MLLMGELTEKYLLLAGLISQINMFLILTSFRIQRSHSENIPSILLILDRKGQTAVKHSDSATSTLRNITLQAFKPVQGCMTRVLRRTRKYLMRMYNILKILGEIWGKKYFCLCRNRKKHKKK